MQLSGHSKLSELRRQLGYLEQRAGENGALRRKRSRSLQRGLLLEVVGYPNRCVTVSHCCFNLRFSDDDI